jgi:hypothetical protein
MLQLRKWDLQACYLISNLLGSWASFLGKLRVSVGLPASASATRTCWPWSPTQDESGLTNTSFAEHVFPCARVPGHYILLCWFCIFDDASLPGCYPSLCQHPPVHPEDQKHVPEDHIQVWDGKEPLSLLWPFSLADWLLSTYAKSFW